MKLFLSILLSFILIASCQQKPVEEKKLEVAVSPELQHYETEIMKIHDEVMPRMSDIHQLSAKLKAIKANSAGTDMGGKDAPEGLDEALESLRTADQMMMDWMKHYSDAKNTVPAELMLTFYEREIEKVTQVKTSMLNAIDEANTWIATHSL
jgi:hypothetical protein